MSLLPERLQAAIFPGSEPRRFRTEADTSRTDEKALERCFFAETLCNSRKIRALSGSSVTLSGWIHSHRYPMWPEKAPCCLCSPHLPLRTAVVSPRYGGRTCL